MNSVEINDYLPNGTQVLNTTDGEPGTILNGFSFAPETGWVEYEVVTRYGIERWFRSDFVRIAEIEAAGLTIIRIAPRKLFPTGNDCMPTKNMTQATLTAIIEFIETSDWPNKRQKIDGARQAFFRKLPLELVGETLLLEGIAIDASELENGHWLRP